MTPTGIVRLLAVSGLCVCLVGCGVFRSKPAVKESMTLESQGSPGDLYVTLAAEYYRLGQFDAALRRAEQAIREDAKNPRAYYMIAVIYQNIGENAKAEENFKRAIEIAPANPDFLNAYGTFFCAQRRYPEAQAQFAKATENPLYATPWVSLTNAGSCAAGAGNSAQAQTHYQRALAANPRFGPALYRLADLEFKRGNAKEAKVYLDRYFQTNEPAPQVLELAIRTERKLGNTKSAATYEQVLRKSLSDAPATKDR